MKPHWQKLASLPQEICTLKFQFFSAVFASIGCPFKNIFQKFKIQTFRALTRCHYLSYFCFYTSQGLPGVSIRPIVADRSFEFQLMFHN